MRFGRVALQGLEAMRKAQGQFVRTRRTWWLVISFAGLTAFGASLGLDDAASAGTIKQTTRFFAVHGATLAELNRDLNRTGPYVSDTGMHHPGATEVRFNGTVTYKSVSRGCAVDKANVGLNLDIMLPKWQRPHRVARHTVIVWNTLAADIKRHELQHAAIAKNYLKRMEMALRNLRPERSCSAMEARVNQVTDRYLSGHQQAQIEFDQVEGRQVNVRLRRALSRTLAGYPAN